EAELLEELVGSAGDPLGSDVREPCDQPEVLAAGEVGVDGRELAGEPDACPHGVGLTADVDPEHLGLTGVGAPERREGANGGGLACAVRPQDAEHGPRLGCEVDAVKRDDVAEALHETGDADGGGGGGVGHAGYLSTYTLGKSTI